MKGYLIMMEPKVGEIWKSIDAKVKIHSVKTTKPCYVFYTYANNETCVRSLGKFLELFQPALNEKDLL